MTVVTVEGPDGVGKTGYARRLAEELGFVFIGAMKPNESLQGIEERAAVRHEMLVTLNEQGVDMVVDRGPLSSIVYSEVHDRSRPDHAWNSLIEIKPFVLYVRCDPVELSIRHADELQDDLVQIAETYDQVVDDLDIDDVEVFELDTTVGALDAIGAITSRLMRLDPEEAAEAS